MKLTFSPEGAVIVLFRSNLGSQSCINFCISFESFIDLCILCGCDYTGTIPKIGPVTALKLIKRHQLIENMPITIPESFEYKMARELFQHFN